jgi:acetone carboxylase gamma subunit
MSCSYSWYQVKLIVNKVYGHNKFNRYLSMIQSRASFNNSLLIIII